MSEKEALICKIIEKWFAKIADVFDEYNYDKETSENFMPFYKSDEFLHVVISHMQCDMMKELMYSEGAPLEDITK